MSGDNFAAYGQNVADTNSGLFGLLGIQQQNQPQQQQSGNVTTTTKVTRRTMIREQDADGNITTHYTEDDGPTPEFSNAPITTQFKTKYLYGNDTFGLNNPDDWFNEVRTPQKFRTTINPTLSNRAFGESAVKPNINEFRKAVLDSHNNFRVNHGVGPLKLNQTLNEQAQKWADTLAELNYMDHCTDHDYGENIYSCSSSNPKHYPTPQDVCQSWYDEIKDYGFGLDPGSEPPYVTHFTQMVWQQTTDLGIGMAKAKDGNVYVVANYNPRGNMLGQFASNVLPLSTKQTRSVGPVPQQQQRLQQFDYAPTFVKSIRQTTFYEKDADGNVTTRVFEGDDLPAEFNMTPTRTQFKTKYLGRNDEFGNSNKWFNDVPKPQPLRTTYNPTLTRQSFGKRPEKPNMEDFRKAALDSHNIFRARHGVGPLKLSVVLNQQAQKWADTLAELNYMDHCTDHEYGENIYTCSSSNPKHYPTPQNVCQSWYDEIKDYGFGKDPGPEPPYVTHFTQVVWKETTELGIGMTKADDGNVYVVANYNPRGNMLGNFANNVLPPGAKQVPVVAKPQQPRTSNNQIGEKPNMDVFRKAVLDSHNNFRAKHGAGLLKLSHILNQQAQKWAETLADRNEMEHCSDHCYGENIYSFTSSNPKQYPSPQKVCQRWYNEIKDYSFGRDPGEEPPYVTHFTQVVWKGTSELGIGMAKACNGKVYVVANYNPGGNMLGDFASNVLPPAPKQVTPVPQNSCGQGNRHGYERGR